MNKSVMGLILLVGLACCSAAVKPMLVNVGAEVCTEAVDSALDAAAASDLVTLACKDASGALVNVIMPRRAWFEAKHLRTSVDGGK